MEVVFRTEAAADAIMVIATNGRPAPRTIVVEGPKGSDVKPWRVTLTPGQTREHAWPTTKGWYDLAVRCEGDATWLRRAAGRIETGKDSISDPLMGGAARLSV